MSVTSHWKPAAHEHASVPDAGGKIAAAAEALLRQSSYLELRSVSCEFHQGMLTLRGRVPSYYLKQLAQALLRQVEGVCHLNNQLDVVAPPPQQRRAWCHTSVSGTLPARPR
jgi:osmotically-inducible protein OsmY